MQIIHTEQIFHIRISFKLIIALDSAVDSIYFNIYSPTGIINNIITRKLVSKRNNFV